MAIANDGFINGFCHFLEIKTLNVLVWYHKVTTSPDDEMVYDTYNINLATWIPWILNLSRGMDLKFAVVSI